MLLKVVLSVLAAWVFQAAFAVSQAGTWQEKLEAADQVRSSEPDKFSRLLDELRVNSNKLSKEETEYLQYLEAYQLIFSGKFMAGMEIQENLAESASSDTVRARALLMLINVYAIQKRWNEGLLAIDEIKALPDSAFTDELRGYKYGVAGVFYNQLGQYSIGLEYGLMLASSFSDKRNQCVSTLLVFESNINLGTLTNAKANYEKAMGTCIDAKEMTFQVLIVRLYVEYLLETLNQAQAAHELLKQHESLVLSAGYAPVTLAYQSLQAKAYWQLGMSEPAFELAQAVSQSPAAANTLEALIRANKVLFDYYSAVGNSEAALAAYIKYAEADKAYLDEVKTKTLAFQLAQHQTLEQQNKISLLDEQNKLLTVQRQLDRAEQYNSRIMIAVMFCVILGMGTWGWNSFRSQRRLKQLAEYDSLTGLFSRGHFTNVAESALNHAFKLNAPASCVLFDVDRFKGINDKYGHSTGDWALKQVAALCRNQLREFEVFGRIGGEEFCLILPKCDREHALQIAEKLRSTLANCKTSACGYDFALTASFGVTDSSLAGYSMDSLLAQADRAMYKAKHTGRNRVCTYCPIEDGEVESASQQSPLTAS